MSAVSWPWDDGAEGSTEPWVTGDYPDPAARLIWLDRKRRVAEGWHPAKWSPPAPRNIDGQAALDLLELRTWLEMTEAAGAVIDVIIEHSDTP